MWKIMGLFILKYAYRAYVNVLTMWPGFGFLVEGLEFEQYGQRARDCSEWDWRIGTHRRDDDDDGEDEDVDDEPAGKRSKNNSGLTFFLKEVKHM